jgi:MerR family mercuric resistance operon transcriptional regulator
MKPYAGAGIESTRAVAPRLTLERTPDCMIFGMMNGHLRIGELAKRTQLSVEAIRFYEKRGLLPKAARSSGRFRLYAADDVGRVGFIRQMQGLGFSLQEIKQLVDLRSRKVEACEEVRELLQEKLTQVQAKLHELGALEAELIADLRKCDKELKHRQRHTAHVCPVLEANAMKVEVLYVPGCPNYQPAVERVQKVLAAERLHAEVREVLVSSAAQAAKLNFPGSPTVRVNGEDIELVEDSRSGLACRLYANQSGVPSEESLRAAVLRARNA